MARTLGHDQFRGWNDGRGAETGEWPQGYMPVTNLMNREAIEPQGNGDTEEAREPGWESGWGRQCRDQDLSLLGHIPIWLIPPEIVSSSDADRYLGA